MKMQVELPSPLPETPAVPSPVRLPRKWPVEVQEGDCIVKIYRTPVVTRGKRYDAFTVSYFASGQRQRRKFTDYAKAKREADRVAEQKAQGALGSAALTADMRVALEEALTLLAKNEGASKATAARLVEVVRDYALAARGLPAGATLVEAVQFYAQRHPSNMARKTVAEVAAEFIADRTSAGCSPIHLRDIEVRLRQFSAAFALPINALSATVIQQWLYGLKRQKADRQVSARSKENMLRHIVALTNFARRMKYITADLAMEISEIPTPKKQPAPIGIYTPDEIRAILTAADAEARPALAISAFAGLRLAEVARLDWRDIRLAERLIVVEAGKAKTAARRLVPISDNLAAWLAPHTKPFGPVNPAIEEAVSVGNALGDRFERAAARAKVQWKRNGFRHSYISYRVATLKDVPAVALECGNSPAIIFSHYRALATETEGKAWFTVTPPPSAANVVAMPAAANQ